MKVLFRKSLAVVLSVLMLFSLCTTLFTVTAAQDETVIITLSDYQPKDTLGPQRLDALIAALKADGIVSADRLLMMGDYSGEFTINASTNGIKFIKEKFSPLVDVNNMLFLQGNHDDPAVTGLAVEGNNDPAYGDYGVYVINEDSYAEWGSYSSAAVEALQSYLDEKVAMGWNKPIFILTHIPLHWSNRTIKDGSGTSGYKFFDVINNAGAQGLNIFYLFGHNHSTGYDDFLGGSCIFLKKGDTMEVCQGSKYTSKMETLNFTYMNAGYTGYYSSDEATAEKTLTLSVLRIRGNEVIISRYSADGQYNLKSAGVVNALYTEGIRPTVNPTVYEGSYKIAADGTATPVDSVYDMRDTGNVLAAAKASASKDVKGLAFRFDMAAAGTAIDAENKFVNDTATVKPYAGDGTNYRLLRMGAVVTNNVSVGTDGGVFRLNAVDGQKIIDVPATYLYETEKWSASYVVRIIDIPDSKANVAIYARPYYVFDMNGTEITVYGDIVAASYNGQLSQNDGVLEW